MSLEFFTEEGRSFAPAASVRKNGQIGFNQGAVKRFGIRDGELAILGYDREEKMIAIKRVKTTQKGAKTITVRANNAWISAKGFLDFFAISYDAGRSYELRSEDDLLVFNIEG